MLLITEQAQPITEWPTPPHENVTEENADQISSSSVFFGGSLFMALSISAIIFGYTFNLSTQSNITGGQNAWMTPQQIGELDGQDQDIIQCLRFP